MATDVDDIFAEDDAPLLSAKEIAEAKTKAKEKVEKAMKQAEIDRIIAEEEQRLKRLAGAKTGKADMDELVDITIDLPEFCPDIRINGVIYLHNRTYSVPRHMANGLREIVQRAQRHQDVLDGKDMEAIYRASKPVKLSPSGVSA